MLREKEMERNVRRLARDAFDLAQDPATTPEQAQAWIRRERQAETALGAERVNAIIGEEMAAWSALAGVDPISGLPVDDTGERDCPL